MPKYRSRNGIKMKKIGCPLNILVIGDVMLDVNEHGTVKRISPEAPVPVHMAQNTSYLLGGAANVAVNLRSLDCDVVLAGSISSDENGKHVYRLAENNQIHFLNLYESEMTTVKRRFWANGQQIFRADIEDEQNKSDYEIYYSKLKLPIAEADIIVLSDYSKGVLKFAPEIIDECNKHNKITIVDPKSDDLTMYTGCTIIKPNEKEFKQICKLENLRGTIHDKCAYLCEKYNIEHLIVTMSERGVFHYQHRNSESLKLAATAKTLFDVTGAGDTFIATLAASIGAGLNMHDSVSYANKASGVAVGRIGTATVRWSEILDEKPNAAIVAEDLYCAEHYVKIARSHNKKIIATNGCFDILHLGHLKLFKHIAGYDGFKILLINSDQSVKSLKGNARPINNECDRINFIQHLDIFDLILSFDDPTPLSAISQLLPDLLVKGGDYVIDSVIGADVVEQNGGNVEIFPLEEGYSTTSIVTKIQRSE